MLHLSVSPVPNLGKTTRSPQSNLTPWILTLNYTQVKDYSKYSIVELEVYVKNYENTPEYADVVKNTNCEILNQEFHSRGDKLLLLCSDEYIEILKGIVLQD